MVTAGANMAFMHAVLAITEPGDEVILPVPFYFNHEMAIQMAGCRAVPVPTDHLYQLRLDAHPRGAQRAHARDRHDVAEQPERRGVERGVAPGGQRALRRARAVSTSPTRCTSTSPTDRRGTCRRGRSPDASAHTISMFSLSKAYGFAGWRIGYMAYPDAAPFGDVEDLGHMILICPTVVAQVASLAALNVGHAVLRTARSRPGGRSGTSCCRPAVRARAARCRARPPTARSTAS